MRIRSTVPDYLRLLEVTPAGRADAWEAQYEAAHPEIFATYYTAWGRPSRRAEAAEQIETVGPTVVEREARATMLLERTAAAFVELGLLSQPEYPVVLMVGQHSSNGWVTEFEGEQTLFLALEFLGEAPYDAVLVSHESLHVAHLQAGAASWPDTVAAGLCTEGLAVALSRHLVPGLSDSAYLWFDADHGGWVDECAARGREIVTRLVDCLHSDAADDSRTFFSRPPDGVSLPMRCGYWVGDRILTGLLERGSSAHDLLTMDYDEVVDTLRRELG
jgi:hypothetical protein